jgi:quercetin dioxygenase-like cupin family protein
MGRFSDPLIVHHLYSATDGKSHLEEIPMQSRDLGGDRHALAAREAKGMNLFYFPDGSVSPWHTADARFLVILLQGQFIIDVDDGKEHRLRPGEVLYSEDWAGKGHRTICDAKTGAKVCLLQQVILEDVDKTQPLRGK